MHSVCACMLPSYGSFIREKEKGKKQIVSLHDIEHEMKFLSFIFFCLLIDRIIIQSIWMATFYVLICMLKKISFFFLSLHWNVLLSGQSFFISFMHLITYFLFEIRYEYIGHMWTHFKIITPYRLAEAIQNRHEIQPITVERYQRKNVSISLSLFVLRSNQMHMSINDLSLIGFTSIQFWSFLSKKPQTKMSSHGGIRTFKYMNI